MSPIRILHHHGASTFEALIAQDGGAGFEKITFPASAVAEVRARGEKTTLLRLFTGTMIPVALPYETLKDYLYGDNMKTRQPFYDLTAVTGPALLPPYSPGELIAGQGIFVGQYAPKDRNGNSLSKTFNVFAAPEDLPGTMKYADAVGRVAGLKNWHGHDGTNFATDRELYAAIRDGRYNGGWIIPTRDILQGEDVDGKKTTPDNILAHKDKGSFKGTFKMAAASGSDYPGWYWSSTEGRDDPSNVWVVRFSDGNGVWDHKHSIRLSCRPVRLVSCRT